MSSMGVPGSPPFTMMLLAAPQNKGLVKVAGLIGDTIDASEEGWVGGRVKLQNAWYPLGPGFLFGAQSGRRFAAFTA
jgi:hypothetical protein